MIGKPYLFYTANVLLSKQTNKQMQYFFATKTNFFQLRKIFTREYITNTNQVLKENIHSLLASFLPKHTNQKRENRGLLESMQFQKMGALFPKIRGSGCTLLHAFSFFFLFPLKRQTLHSYIHTYICVIYVCDVRYISKYIAFCVHSFALLRFFVSVLCVALYLLSERFFFSFSFLLKRPTPPPFHDTESVATPFLNFFIFLVFKNFFVEKMRYDLFTFRVCLCRYLIFTF